MARKSLIILLLISFVFLQGCANSIKGFAGGFKEDWKNWSKTDDWIQEHLW